MVHTSRMTNVIMAITLLWTASQSKPLSAASLNLPDVPLVVATTAAPNIMLLVDNSLSMNNIVPDSPYDANSTYFTCPASNTLTPSTTYSMELIVTGGIPSFSWVNTTTFTSTPYTWGTSSGKKCFKPALSYNAKLYTLPAAGSFISALDSVYTGNYLNWYFGSSPTNWGSVTQKPGTAKRIDIAKTAAKQLVDSLSNVRMGLATYNN